MKNEKTKISYEQFTAAKNSVAGRLSRLKYTRQRWASTKKSPIAAVGVFDDEIEQMETSLKSMQNRLNQATITVKL